MPTWRPGCLRGSVYEPEVIQYRPATNGYPGPTEDDLDEKRGTTLVDLRKIEGCGLGLIIAAKEMKRQKLLGSERWVSFKRRCRGGLDKGVRPHISNLRPGGLAHRSDSLQVGDVLLSVNGIRTSNMKHDEIINLLKNADENVRLEIEYDLPDIAMTDSFSVRCRQTSVSLVSDGSSFGFTLRGGMCASRTKCRPLTITQIRPGGSAHREGSLNIGDRILAVNDFSVVSLSLTEMTMLLSQCTGETSFTVEYDISVIDAVQKATGPLLIEIDKTPGAALGITLSHAKHKGKHCVCIDSIRPMSIADRSGALHMGDHILSIDGASVEHMTVAEATQLLKSSPGEHIRMEILPVRLVEQKSSRDSILFNAGFQKNIIPSISSPVLNTSAMFNGFNPASKSQTFGFMSRMSTEMLSGPSKRRRSWAKTDKKMASSVSVASATNSIFTSSNQVCRMDTNEVLLYGERCGLGIVLESTTLPHCMLEDPPIVTRLEPNTAADRCGVIQEGDRILTINGQDVCEKTLDEVTSLLQELWQRAKLEVEFDIADSVSASSGTFVVKLPKKPGGIGITLSTKTKLGNPILITEVKKGSVAYRCGSVQPGDKLISINDVRTENLCIDDAVDLLRGDEDIIKLKLRRDDPCTDETGAECISYTVELQRNGGPLGITIIGTDDPSDPIVISSLADGGLAARTGAIRVGDKLLAINGVSTASKSLTEATNMLQSAGELVTLKIARPDKLNIKTQNTSKKSSSEKEETCKSTTPVRSIDSALESWDSSGPDIYATSQNRTHSVSVPKIRPHSAGITKGRDNKKRKSRPYSSDSTDTGDDFGKKLSELRISDEAWEGDQESSKSDESSPGEIDDWSKAFKNFEVQSDMLEQMASTSKQHSTGSLDRKVNTKTNKKERQKVRRNWSHSTSRGAISQNDLRGYPLDRRARRCASSSSARDLNQPSLKDQYSSYSTPSPQSIQLHRVTLEKDTPGEDFGFGVSDGVYDKGVYISAVRPGSKADRMGLKCYDRILQINKKRTRDMTCGQAIPLICGSTLDIVVCRNPLTLTKTALKEHQRRGRPLPPDPPDDEMSCDFEDQSTDSIPVYMNVYNLDTPIARSEKSFKTV